ncbi:MAG: hypothetical protein ACLFTL_08185 [Alphaproteobacteria bacterium]
MRVEDADLPARVRAHLQNLQPAQVPLTYRELANGLGLRPPHTIHRLTLALETTMREDVERGRPLIAALVVSKTGGDLPQRGFFELAATLGRLPAAPDAAVAAYRREFDAAVAAWLAAGAP